MSVPGHKQRQDLAGAVVAGRRAAVWRPGHHQARGRAAGRRRGPGGAAVGRGLVPVLRGRVDPRQPGAGAGGRLTRPGGDRHPDACTGRCCWAWCWPGCGRCGCGPRCDPGSGLPAAVAVDTVRRRAGRAPRRLRGVPRRPVLRGHDRRPGRARRRRARGRGVPLIVDAAWAAHLGFHPGLPPHALAAGADAMVTSAHKALPAYTQGALVLARTGLLDAGPAGPGVRGHPHHQPDRLDRREHRRGPGPAGARRQARCAPGCCARWPAARQRLRAGARAGRAGRAGRRADQAGRAAGRHRRERLRRRGRPDRRRDAGGDGRPRHPRCRSSTLADDEDQVASFIETLIAAIERHRGAPRQPVPAPAWTVMPQTVLAPREAFFAAERDGRRRRRGRPGQRRAGRALPARRPGARARRADHGRGPERAARRSRADGGRIAYAADPAWPPCRSSPRP